MLFDSHSHNGGPLLGDVHLVEAARYFTYFAKLFFSFIVFMYHYSLLSQAWHALPQTEHSSFQS